MPSAPSRASRRESPRLGMPRPRVWAVACVRPLLLRGPPSARWGGPQGARPRARLPRWARGSSTRSRRCRRSRASGDWPSSGACGSGCPKFRRGPTPSSEGLLSPPIRGSRLDPGARPRIESDAYCTGPPVCADATPCYARGPPSRAHPQILAPEAPGFDAVPLPVRRLPRPPGEPSTESLSCTAPPPAPSRRPSTRHLPPNRCEPPGESAPPPGPGPRRTRPRGPATPRRPRGGRSSPRPSAARAPRGRRRAAGTRRRRPGRTRAPRGAGRAAPAGTAPAPPASATSSRRWASSSSAWASSSSSPGPPRAAPPRRSPTRPSTRTSSPRARSPASRL